MKNRAQRIHDKERIIKKRKKDLKNISKNYLEKFEGKENKLASKHPLDCGNAKCGVCHPHKKWPSKCKRKKDLIEEELDSDRDMFLKQDLETIGEWEEEKE